MKNCPNCQSDQFKKVSLVYAEGVSATVGVGVGVGIGTGGVGLGAGVSKSVLAASCAPPIRDKNGGNSFSSMIVFVFFIPILISWFIDRSIYINWWWTIWISFGGALIWRHGDKDQIAYDERFEKSVAEYDKSYLCLRCGTRSLPFNEQG